MTRHMTLPTLTLLLLALPIVAQTAPSIENDTRARCPQIEQAPSRITDHASIDVVFVLDSTGSMGGLIDAAKRKIWSIANVIAGARPTPELRLGLLTYRDRGDSYVTRWSPLSADLDAAYAWLIDVRAGGGGDGPESVNQALHEAVTRFAWPSDPSTLKLIFLVGDAPPHMDYADDVPYAESVRRARATGIVINTIQCGDWPETTTTWQSIAAGSAGEFFRIARSGGATAMSTPYDAELARHSRLLDSTLVPYGGPEARAVHEKRLDASRKIDETASAEALADRAAYRAGEAGGETLTGASELVHDVIEQAIRLDEIPPEQLPEQMQPWSPEKRREYIEAMAEQRRGLREEIEWLGQRRRDYLRERFRSAADAFDQRVLQALRCQARSSGIVLD